ncbi:hypothetical protein SAY87_005271 [Trapa incisa]|uniref:Uncharacterized protein n=1 Tax=Trapa incisa TaxID=236973 RepID=A0AAN7K2M8_9MYRT|nr:hypothetical protein SAY87_005271 [Trapa incisa]
MEVTSTILHSNTVPFTFSFNGSKSSCSLRHFNKRLAFISPPANAQRWKPLETTTPIHLSRERARNRLLLPPNCSISTSPTTDPEPQGTFLKYVTHFSLDALKRRLLQLTPVDVIKISGVVSVSIAATKWTVNLLLDPFFWMYFSWTWLFWPWLVAIALAIYGFYCLRKHLQGKASIFEQLAVVTSAFAWLTLVPPAHFNGYLQGWPFVFFFVYHYFFFFNVSVRRRLYGDYYARHHDPKWDIDPPKWQRLLFCAGIMLSHWLAAFEGPELHKIPGGWSNIWVWILILSSLLMQYNSTLYLAKYSEKVVVPTEVVQFGPYRWIRHPIYASTMLLFASYFAALRAPLSLLFIVAICSLYYEQKVKLEEALMVDTFGERYLEYASKVKYKLIPFIY